MHAVLHAHHHIHHVSALFDYWRYLFLMVRRLHASPASREQIEERARFECIDAVNRNEFDGKELLRLRSEGHTWLEIWRMIQATRATAARDRGFDPTRMHRPPPRLELNHLQNVTHHRRVTRIDYHTLRVRSL